MTYFKIIDGNYIQSIGKSASHINPDIVITEAEYNTILNLIHNKPIAESGYDYRLREDLEWELYELPEPEPIEEEATTEDYEVALAELGVK